MTLRTKGWLVLAVSAALIGGSAFGGSKPETAWGAIAPYGILLGLVLVFLGVLMLIGSLSEQKQEP